MKKKQKPQLTIVSRVPRKRRPGASIALTVATVILGAAAYADDGVASKKTVLHSQATVNQVPSSWSPGAKAASDRFEGLVHGRPMVGTNPTLLEMSGYVPPGKTPEQAAMEARGLPKFPRMPGPTTAADVARWAGEPMDPAAGLLPGGRAAIDAANEKSIRDYVREEHGPIYIPPLHRDHNRAAASSNKSADHPVGAGSAHAYTKDHLYSVREMTDGSGNIVYQQTFDPYGNATQLQGSGPKPDIGYGGYYVHGPSGLLLTQTRAYNSALGRFLNRDPIAETAGPNLFAYCGNNPINFRDPSGMWQWYGNWGGPNWTNGFEGNGTNHQGEMSNFPNMPGQKNFYKPWDPRDRCYYWHDVCLHNCGRIGCKNPTPDQAKLYDEQRQKCRRDCDKQLAQCLQYVKDTYPDQFPDQFGGISDIGKFSANNSPNNDPGQFVPGLQQYPQGFDPGVTNPGVVKQ